MPWPAGTKHVVTVRVTGIPNMDINLAAADGDGLHGASVDEGAPPTLVLRDKRKSA